MIYCRATDAVAHAPTKQCQLISRMLARRRHQRCLCNYGATAGPLAAPAQKSIPIAGVVKGSHGDLWKRTSRHGRTISVPGACPHATSLDRIRPGGKGNGHTTPPALPGACPDHQYCTLHRHVPGALQGYLALTHCGRPATRSFLMAQVSSVGSRRRWVVEQIICRNGVPCGAAGRRDYHGDRLADDVRDRPRNLTTACHISQKAMPWPLQPRHKAGNRLALRRRGYPSVENISRVGSSGS